MESNQAGSTCEMGWFKTAILSAKGNLAALMNLSGRSIDQVHKRKPLRERILDMDSSVIREAIVLKLNAACLLCHIPGQTGVSGDRNGFQNGKPCLPDKL